MEQSSNSKVYLQLRRIGSNSDDSDHYQNQIIVEGIPRQAIRRLTIAASDDNDVTTSGLPA